MNRAAIIIIGLCLLAVTSNAQTVEAKKKPFLIGFNGILPSGIAPSTALTNDGAPLEKAYGIGMIIQKEVMNNFSVFLDFNAYNYNNKLADQGDDVQSIWTVAESATHWDEPGAPQILYVHNLPTDVHFDMATSGVRLGAKMALGDGKVKPWIGGTFGFYAWSANYFNENKDKTYGGDKGNVTGVTFMGGVDMAIMEGFILTLFADLASPVAEYTIEGLFYPQWDITDYQAHVMGQYRFGLTLSFDAGKKN